MTRIGSGVSALLVIATGCAGKQQAAAPPSAVARFPNAEEIYVLPDKSDYLRYVTGTAPRYPNDLRRRNKGGRVFVSFVVDTAGLVEMPSVTLIAPAATNELFQSVCRALPTYRFEVGSPKRRSFVTQPFDFFIVTVPPDAQSDETLASARLLVEKMEAMTAKELATFLEKRPHCS